MLFSDPILVSEFLLDSGLRLGEICSENLPCGVEHLVKREIDVYRQYTCRICLCIFQAPEVVVAQVETVLQLCLGILGIGIKTHGCIHDLAVVLAGLLSLHELLKTRE